MPSKRLPPDDQSNVGEAQSVPDAVQRQSSTLSAGLYVVATPIGHLKDITLRALDVLKQADVIACEDTRVSRKLLSHYGIHTPIMSYHEHNAEHARPKMMAMLAEGQSVALISDAGTPLISDPGYKLVRDAHDAGATVVPIVGASSVMAGLVIAGQPTDQFAFIGFLPTTTNAMHELLAPYKAVPATLVCFSTASKIIKHLEAIEAVFGDVDLSICRELTKLYEEVRRASVRELLARFRGGEVVRGEVVLVVRVEPVDEGEAALLSADAWLNDLLGHMPLKVAVDMVLRHVGGARNDIYQRALAIKKTMA